MAVPKKPAKKPAGLSPAQKAAKAAEVARLREYYKQNGHIPTLLSNESRSRFGEADSGLVSNLGKLVATGKITRDEAQRRVRQGSAVTNPDSLRAGLDVSAELDPKINAISRRRQTAKQGFEQSSKMDTEVTEAKRAQIAQIYQQMVAQMQQNTPQIAGIYDQQAAGLAANTASLQDQIKAAYQQANAATQAQVAGMGGGQTQGQAQGTQDQAFLSGLAGTLGLAGQNQTAAGRSGAVGIQTAGTIGMGHEGAGRQAEMLQSLVQRLAESRADYTAEDSELSGAAGDLEESRFAKLYEGKQALAAAREQAAAEAEDRQFQRDIATSKLGLAEQELGLKSRGVDIDQQRVDILSRKTNADLQKERNKYIPGTPEYDEIQAAIDLKRAQAASTLTNAQTARQRAADAAANNNVRNGIAQQNADTRAKPKPGKASNYGKGTGGAITYINAGVRPEFRPNANRVLGYLNREFAGDSVAGAKRAEQIIKKYKYPPDVASAIRRMVGIYYGKGT